MANLTDTYIKLPVAPLALVVMDSAAELGREVDDHIVAIRKNGDYAWERSAVIQGYSKDSFIVNAKCPRFGSGEAKGEYLESVRGKDLFILVDVCNSSITYRMNGCINHMSPDDHYQDLKRMIAAASGVAKRVNIIMPFLYEGRQHKRSGRESLDCANMLEELYSMGISNFITFDAHDPRVANAVPLKDFDNYMPPTHFMRALLDAQKDLVIDKDHMVVISPDEGALNRAIYFANVMGVNTGMFYKRRDYTKVVNGKNPIVAHEFLGDSLDGKDVIIIDDMISSGESMLDTSRQLKEMNAKRVFICCTFGLFTNGMEAFDRAYEKCWFDKVIVTNLNYIPQEYKDRVYMVEANMSESIADVIHMMNHDVPMSNIKESLEDVHVVIDKYNRREFYELEEHA